MPCTLTALYANGDFAIENGEGVLVDDDLPVWTPALEVADDDANSFFPVLFCAGHSQRVLAAEVHLSEDYAGCKVHLRGMLDGQTILRSDSSEGVSGRWCADLHATFDVSALARRAGDVCWYLHSDGADRDGLALATTRLELTWIYQAPAPLFDNVSQARVLRMVFSQVDTAAAPSTVVAGIAQMCYYGFNKIYDVVNGAPFYGTSQAGGLFELAEYLVEHKDPQRVNCYDQAGMLQTLLGSIGVPNTWRFMAPFGYMSNTYLVGVGLCNNPLHGDGAAGPVVERDDAERLALRGHAFVSYGGAVLDACTGPRLGRENLGAFIIRAIDTETTLATPGNTGTAADVSPCVGIESLNFAPMASDNPDLAPGMRAILGSPDEVRAALHDYATSVDWDELLGQLSASHELKAVRRAIVPAGDGVFSRWSAQSPAGPVTIRVFKAQNRRVAVARMIDYLNSFQHSPAQRMGRMHGLGGAGLLSHDKKLACFVSHNVFVLVSAGAGSTGLIAADIERAIAAAPRSERRIVHSHEAITLHMGERRTLATGMSVRHSLRGSAVRLAGRRPYEIDLRAGQVGVSRLRLALVREPTLDMDLHQVRVEVLA